MRTATMSLLTELGNSCYVGFLQICRTDGAGAGKNHFDTQAHNLLFVGMSIQRVHLHLSKESLAFGRQLARKKKTSISKLVEGFFMGGRNHARSGKPFSERWAGNEGKISMRKLNKSDVRGMRLAKKYA